MDTIMFSMDGGLYYKHGIPMRAFETAARNVIISTVKEKYGEESLS